MISPSTLSLAVAPASLYGWLSNIGGGCASPTNVIVGGVVSLTLTETDTVSSEPGVPSLMV